MANAAVFTCAGPHRSSYSRKCRTAGACCVPASPWPNSKASPSINPIPKPRSTCNAPSVNCWLASPSSAVEPAEHRALWKCRAVDSRGKPPSLRMGARAGFPPLSTALGKRSAFPTFPQRLLRFLFSLKTQTERTPFRPSPQLRPSGSSFDENMLRSKPVGAFHMGPIRSNVVKMANKTQHS